MAPPELVAARPMSITAHSPEEQEKVLAIFADIWRQMSDEERKQALAGSAEMAKSMSADQAAHSVNVWSLFAQKSAGGGTSS